MQHVTGHIEKVQTEPRVADKAGNKQLKDVVWSEVANVHRTHNQFQFSYSKCRLATSEDA